MASTTPAAHAPSPILRAAAIVLAAAAGLFALTGCESEPSPLSPAEGEPYGITGTDLQESGLRDHYVDVADARSATVMVYMCGADLESWYGCASSDIDEMLAADLGDDVDVVIETGGADDWWNSDIDAGLRQRWHIEDGSLVLDGDTGAGTMLDGAEVSDFIRWSAQNHPADRYILVFWDHGGGTVGGFGSDERYPDQPSLTLLDLRQAISDGGQKIDIVGFDACLMGTIETAYALEPCADYLLASEEIEPGDGWAWTDFLTLLGSDPSTSSTDVGACAIDSYTKHYFDQGADAVTLSLVDLREVPYVYENLGGFLDAARSTIDADNSRFGEMSQARSGARAYCEGSLDQVDLADLASRTSFEGKDDLLAAIGSCVKYRGLTSLEGSNGLAVYFPYSEVEHYSGMRDVLNDIDYTEPTEFYDYFLSIMGNSDGSGASTGGQVNPGEAQQDEGSALSSAPSTETYADDSYSAEDWFDDLLDFDYEEAPDELELREGDGGYVVDMDDDAWSMMADFYITVLERHGDGYLMLGSDNVYDVTDDGDIVVSYDGEWLCLDGEPVSFFCAQTAQNADGEPIYTGTIPAILNGSDRIDIVVSWPPASEQDGDFVGRVRGYRRTGESGSAVGRLASFSEGDEIVPIFDYYDADGDWLQTIEGTAIKVADPDELAVTYEEFEHDGNVFWGTMTDIYGDRVDTETLEQ